MQTQCATVSLQQPYLGSYPAKTLNSVQTRATQEHSRGSQTQRWRQNVVICGEKKEFQSKSEDFF